MHTLRQDPRWQVVGLLTTVTDGYERIAMHGIRREILLAQARAAGLPVLEARIPQACDNDTYTASFAAALAQAAQRWPGLSTIAFGDLFLADVRAWRQALCAGLGWDIQTPLFGADTTQLAAAMITGGLRARLCCVDTQQLDADFCGREFDAALLRDLPAGVDPCGENGEFHTCVHAGPMFDRALALVPGERVLREARFEYVELSLG
ncbi:Dph6-related ATP pyrophosphatase [Agrilutibacter solisilvae]|uniref:ATP-binding protein n=1 Tax=Agrilutibacter solisilvae TaxID=2763317 RepID=A0A974Y203_9GAMM|nr:ATP-binding protein [Lysobacter solisilvae]